MKTDQKPFEFCARAYRRLLLFYPAPHRREYGAAMEQLFRDQCRDAWQRARGWGLTVLWLHVAGDLVRTVTIAHFWELKQRISMLTQISVALRNNANIRTTFRALFAAVFLAVLGTSVVLALLTPNQYASTSRIIVQRSPTDVTPARYQRYVDRDYDPYFIQTEFETIQSDAVLGPVVKKLKLAEAWAKTSEGGKRLTESEAIQQLRNRLDLRPVRDTLWQSSVGVKLVFSAMNAAQIARSFPQRSLFEIRVFSKSADEAAEIANEVAESYRYCREQQMRKLMLREQVPLSRRVEIVDTAAPALRPIWPNRPFTIFLGFSGGLLLATLVGGIGVLLLLWFRRSPESKPMAA